MVDDGPTYKTGIVLSGGGARGFAHAGILKALNDFDIYPDVISGVSAGAIVGALYADGHSPDEIYELFSSNKSFYKYVKLILPRQGIFKTKGLRENLADGLSVKRFEELQIPLVVAATNLNRAKVTYFSSGELLDRILASAAIPVLFTPVKIEDEWYVDGGVLDNFPLSPIEQDCEQLIGVNLNPIQEEENFDQLSRIAERTFHLSVSVNLHDKVKRCDRVFQPEKLGDYSLLDTTRGKEMFDLGYDTAMEILKKDASGV